MNRLFVPLIALLSVMFCAYKCVDTRRLDAAKSTQALKKEQDALDKSKKDLSKRKAELLEFHSELGEARDFLAEWEQSYSRTYRTGIEPRVMELGTAYEVSPHSPRFLPTPVLYWERGETKIQSRSLEIQAEGNLTSLIRFVSEVERSIPIGIMQSLVVTTGERDPLATITMSVLSRNFSEMTPLPDGAAAASNVGIYKKKPDSTKVTIPVLSDNLFARGSAKAQGANVISATDIRHMMPSVKITGIVWNKIPSKRCLIANGMLLRVGEQVPKTLVKGNGKITLIDVTGTSAKFRVQTDDINPVTGKTEANSLERELKFEIFEEVNSEG